MSNQLNARAMLADAKFYESYSRYDDTKGRYETWDEAVERVMNMHRKFYAAKMTDELADLIDAIEIHYKQKLFLGAQRTLQFGGEQILKNHMKLYNCTSSYADRAEFFGEIFWILLCGCGAGFSVQKHHVAKLPELRPRNKQPKLHVIEDSIEGWATALDVLLSSFFIGGGKHPEYEGRRVYFDHTKIRKKGALISGGFKAPGPEPLIRALGKIEDLLNERAIEGTLRPIDVYDIVMYAADSVIAGGVRRSATICLFSKDDDEMAKAKTGNWYIDNPQRGRSNNSAVIVRNDVTKEEFEKLMTSVKEFGEPGFVFVESTEHCFNPCVEIGMFPQYEGKSGWQGCNLVEINGDKCSTEEMFYEAAYYSSALATLQAGYTNFGFVDPVTQKIFEREALIGVSVTGWMTNPDVLLNADIQRKAAAKVLEANERVAAIIGINVAARATCTKPAGSTSVLLQGPSGIHGDHSPRYLRHVQMNKEQEIVQTIANLNPYMVEESAWSTNGTDYVVAFPITIRPGTITKEDLYGVKLLEKVKLVQQNWVEAGTRLEACVDPTVRHNVSNTVTVRNHEWQEVTDYLFENRQYFSGVSFIGETGDKDYVQAPNTEVLSEEQIIEKYGVAALFASGLIVDANKGFKNLWEACMIAQGPDHGTQEEADIRAEWIRRFNRFAWNYFQGDTKKTEYLLKDVYLLHKWEKIRQNFRDINFAEIEMARTYTDIDTMASQACVGGACAI